MLYVKEQLSHSKQVTLLPVDVMAIMSLQRQACSCFCLQGRGTGHSLALSVLCKKP